MNILLLGNGFDIYHRLPTNYHNFLNVIDFLINNKNTEFNTIGEIFKNEELQLKDSFISECYEYHRDVYEKIEIKRQNLDKIINLCENNIWFQYLLKTFNKDVGWIDFEKEIAFVLKCFNRFLKNNCIIFYPYVQLKEKEYVYVIENFNFFYCKSIDKSFNKSVEYIVKDEYRIEYPLGSNNIVVNKEKIISDLFKELVQIANALQIYLKCFVDASLDTIKFEAGLDKRKIFCNSDYAITFNYTNTFEKLYSKTIVTHIHGNVYDRIVLGINPDEFDTLEHIDTSLICFKKYFQRELFGTDEDLWEFRRMLHKDDKENIVLIIMGHSLDITDEDIIKDLIYEADEIYILYHNEDAKGSYISNLVKMFGKKQFDDIRKNKIFKLLSLKIELFEFSNKLEERTYLKIIDDIVEEL